MKLFGIINFFVQLMSFSVVEKGAGGATTKSVDDRILETLDGVDARLKGLSKLESEFEVIKEDAVTSAKKLDEIQKQIIAFSKSQVQQASSRRRMIHRGLVDDDCAAHLGAVYLVGMLRQDTEGRVKGALRQMAESEIKNILGVEWKTAISSSDIPLPTQYSGDIVELVYQYGVARQYCTVFPLGAGTVKLPKLTTDPTFALLAQSGGVTEKSPQAAFTTFNAEKFGGLIRLPSEIEEDSIIAMGQFLARYAARNMARCEDYQAFMSTGAGSGVNGTGPGLVTAVGTDSCTTVMASTKTHYSDATLQNFRDLRGASGLSGAVLGQSAYYVHPTFEALFATFNTSATVTPYQRNAPGGPTLDGFPIRWVSVLPAYSTGANVSSTFALFGDTSFQYLGLRGGMRFDTSREAAFTTDEVLVRAIERMTVGYMATKAVAGLVTAAS